MDEMERDMKIDGIADDTAAAQAGPDGIFVPVRMRYGTGFAWLSFGRAGDPTEWAECLDPGNVGDVSEVGED